MDTHILDKDKAPEVEEERFIFPLEFLALIRVNPLEAMTSSTALIFFKNALDNYGFGENGPWDIRELYCFLQRKEEKERLKYIRAFRKAEFPGIEDVLRTKFFVDDNDTFLECICDYCRPRREIAKEASGIAVPFADVDLEAHNTPLPGLINVLEQTKKTIIPLYMSADRINSMGFGICKSKIIVIQQEENFEGSTYIFKEKIDITRPGGQEQYFYNAYIYDIQVEVEEWSSNDKVLSPPKISLNINNEYYLDEVELKDGKGQFKLFKNFLSCFALIALHPKLKLQITGNQNWKGKVKYKVIDLGYIIGREIFYKLMKGYQITLPDDRGVLVINPERTIKLIEYGKIETKKIEYKNNSEHDCKWKLDTFNWYNNKIYNTEEDDSEVAIEHALSELPNDINLELLLTTL